MRFCVLSVLIFYESKSFASGLSVFLYNFCRDAESGLLQVLLSFYCLFRFVYSGHSTLSCSKSARTAKFGANCIILVDEAVKFCGILTKVSNSAVYRALKNRVYTFKKPDRIKENRDVNK